MSKGVFCSIDGTIATKLDSRGSLYCQKPFGSSVVSLAIAKLSLATVAAG
ncbi:MAG: hypothetical protein HC930_07515 [Hydrococcus sp. SU_1_0]|nr:hypothetical protein [Hydrococcus sp. SU_1_0]